MTPILLNGPRVLLIGRRASWGASLLATLEESGCAVLFAQEHTDIRESIERQVFDLILAGSECRHTTHRLPGLVGSHTSVFYLFPVEDTCWWVPALRYGVDCYGTIALRPSQFAAQLKEFLRPRPVPYAGVTLKTAS